MTSTLPLVEGCLFLDNSKIELITTCPTAAYYYICCKRELASERSALRFGTFIHAALAYRYKNQPTWSESAQLALLSDLFTASPLESEGWRNLDSASKLLRAFNALHPASSDVMLWPKGHKLAGEPMIEVPFAAYIGTVRGIKIIYMGRIDRVLQGEDGIFVDDWKTTSKAGDLFWQDQAMSEQHRGYCWALRACLGTEPTGYSVSMLCCRESIVNSIFNDLTGTLINTSEKSKAKPVEFGRQRVFTKEPPGQLDEWRENLLLQIDTFLYQAERGTFAKHHKHCIGKYGPCQYYHVDELPLKSRATALASSAFMDVTWSPLNKTPNAKC